MNIDVYRGFFQPSIQGKGDRFAGQRLDAAFADADLRTGLGVGIAQDPASVIDRCFEVGL